MQRLGWGVVSVLKQERYEIYQEATALRARQAPRAWQWADRAVDLWEIKDLPFTDAAIGPVRVVLADELWTERRQRGGRTERVARQRHWRWLATRELAAADVTQIWHIGHQRWGVENHAFNELTPFYHLTHCPRHEGTAIQVWLLILVLGFNLFELFARLHGKLWRQGQTTLPDLSEQLDRALEAVPERQPLWSG